ncbi:competence type IV pilus assembly protein ComGB [Metabacillus arenae]|uniref:Type II secretion system F family protein n=1 Tax=Metabacillus arenae TaxID=2771434 RepID=A0A926NIP0_9BACI|nr:competence type IV pilus assembly protein ComGB [Metabacillus arenae]MBD1378837.1 type II secretion system F family protein [Metabacillus arenae]
MEIRRTWLLKDQANLLQQLSSLLSKGYTLNEALQFVMMHLSKQKKEEIERCLQQLKQGIPFQETLQQLKFHKDVLAILLFSEEHGDLCYALNESSKLLDQRLSHLEKITKVIRYPLFLLFSVSIMIYIIQGVIGPQFQSMYQSMNISPSFFTSLLLYMFEGIKWAFYLFLGVIVLLLVFYFLVFRKKSPHEKMSYYVRIPLINHFIRLFNSYFFSAQLSSLLRAGVSVFDSFQIFKDQHYMPFYKEEGIRVIEGLTRGEMLESLFLKSNFYDDKIVQVIAYGQANSQLSRELYTYSQFLLDQLERKVEKWTTVIQPAIYLFVGIVVLIVYLSILMPMYQMMNQI